MFPRFNFEALPSDGSPGPFDAWRLFGSACTVAGVHELAINFIPFSAPAFDASTLSFRPGTLIDASCLIWIHGASTIVALLNITLPLYMIYLLST